MSTPNPGWWQREINCALAAARAPERSIRPREEPPPAETGKPMSDWIPRIPEPFDEMVFVLVAAVVLSPILLIVSNHQIQIFGATVVSIASLLWLAGHCWYAARVSWPRAARPPRSGSIPPTGTLWRAMWRFNWRSPTMVVISGIAQASSFMLAMTATSDMIVAFLGMHGIWWVAPLMLLGVLGTWTFVLLVLYASAVHAGAGQWPWSQAADLDD